jgi:hypothetical protein
MYHKGDTIMSSTIKKAAAPVETETPEGYSKIDFGLGQFAKFETIGDSVEGTVHGTREVSSNYGPQTVVDIEQDAAHRVTVGLSKGLIGVPWEQYKGKVVRIVYTSDLPAKKGQKACRMFEVYVQDLPFD